MESSNIITFCRKIITGKDCKNQFLSTHISVSTLCLMADTCYLILGPIPYVTTERKYALISNKTINTYLFSVEFLGMLPSVYRFRIMAIPTTTEEKQEINKNNEKKNRVVNNKTTLYDFPPLETPSVCLFFPYTF